MRKLVYLNLTFFFLLLFSLLGGIYFIRSSYARQKDAIGMRIAANEKHLPVSVWYDKQDFMKKGNPTAIKVDGYDAIQDGRTIYVNAANIVHPEALGFYYCNEAGVFSVCNEGAGKKNFYTNIYIISYNEGASAGTVNAFNQLIQNWKFNSNINNENIKQALCRDTRRLADISYIEEKLEDFKKAYGYYPILKAGTYISEETMSKWPSWQNELGGILKINVPVDPVNSFYPFLKCPENSPDCYCPDHSPETCWDNQTKKFNGELKVNAGLQKGDLKNALVYYYKSLANGVSYEFNANRWESPYISGSDIRAMQAQVSAVNTAPSIQRLTPVLGFNETQTFEIKAYDWNIFTKKINWNNPIIEDGGNCLAGTNPIELLDNTQKADAWDGQKYVSYKKLKVITKNLSNFSGTCEAKIKMEVNDKQANEASFLNDSYSLVIKVSNQAPNISGLSKNIGVLGYEFISKIIAQDSPSDMSSLTYTAENLPAGLSIPDAKINQIKGVPTSKGDYNNVKITVTDKFGLTTVYASKISIINRSPQISVANAAEIPVGLGWEFNIEANDNAPYFEIDGKAYPHLPLSYQLLENPEWISLNGTKISGLPPATGTYPFKIRVKDRYEETTDKVFTLKVVNHNPKILEWPKDGIKRTKDKFTFQTKAKDADGHILKYSLNGIPDISNTLVVDDKGLIQAKDGQFKVSDAGDYNIILIVSDNYGGEDRRSFTLRINTFCGDGTVQNPNMEGVSEECDSGTKFNDSCSTLAGTCNWIYKTMTAEEILAKGGSGDGIAWDDNNKPDESKDVNVGAYLKLLGIMPTPYLWIANSNHNKITKIRTYARCYKDDGGSLKCPKKITSGWDYSIKEDPGQIIQIIDLKKDGSSIKNPSRTAVNVMDGSAWVAGRDSANVAKLDIEGNIKKICYTGNGPRGVTIDKNGDVWVGNQDSGNIVRISGDDSNCDIKETINTGGGPYGLALDSKGNIWISNRGGSITQKIDFVSKEINAFSTPNAYGIAVDKNDNVWVANTGGEIYRIDQQLGSAKLYSAGCTRTRGVTIDKNGNIWSACDDDNQVSMININKPEEWLVVDNIGGKYPIGICGDSEGYVWASNYQGDSVTAINIITRTVDKLVQNVSGTFSGQPYTYSDMTGLNRAMMIRQGVWITNILDSAGNSAGNYDNQHWGLLDWDEVKGNEQIFKVFIRASNREDDLEKNNVLWSEYDKVNHGNSSASCIGRYLQIRVELMSTERGITPVISNLRIINPQ